MRIVLHVGMHKTASSTIQERFKINNKLLQQHGYFYIDKQRKVLLNAVLKTDFKPWRDVIDDALKNNYTPIISHESFSYILCRTKASKRGKKATHLGHWLFKKLKKHGFHITVIGFIRDQPSYLNSRYTQHVKRFATDKSFPDYVADAMQPNIHWTTCDPEKLFDWLMHSAASQIFLFPFGRSITPPPSLLNTPRDPFDQLIHCLDIPNSISFKPIEDLNVQPGNLGVHTALALSQEFKNTETLQGKTAKRKVRALIYKEAEQRNWFKTPYIGVNPELNRHIQDYFSAANNRFAQRVWGCRWNEIFTTEISTEQRNLSKAEQDEIHQAIKQIRRRLFPMRKFPLRGIRNAIRNVMDAVRTS